MLKDEFIHEWGLLNPRGPSAANMTPCVWTAIQTVYTSRQGDHLFTGQDRHRKCALWVRDHQPTVERLARIIGRRQQRERWQAFRSFALRTIARVDAGEIGPRDAAHYLRCATNLEVS